MRFTVIIAIAVAVLIALIAGLAVLGGEQSVVRIEQPVAIDALPK